MHYNQKVGKFGEKLAGDFLRKKGYRIIDTNVRASYKEIDIVAEYDNELVFVEVKTRTSVAFGRADQSVTRRKIKNLRRAMSMYLRDKHYQKPWVRADLVAIDIDRSTKKAKIKHYKEII